MTILLHGENSVASRNRLNELKETFAGEVVEVDPKNPLLPESSLFSKQILSVIWQDKKASATQIKAWEKDFPGLKVEEFKLDPVVWQFLGNLRPGNQEIFLPLWQKYLQTDPPEIAASMLIRQIRLLLLAKIDKGGPDDFKNLAPWQKSRLAGQAKSFSLESLKEILKKL